MSCCIMLSASIRAASERCACETFHTDLFIVWEGKGDKKRVH